MRAIVVGAVESTRVAVRAISGAPGWDLPLIVSLPPDLGHRHSDFVDLTLDAQCAKAHLLHVSDINADPAIEAICGAKPDILFVIGWSQICRTKVREAAADCVIGYHPAPLPRMRGRAAIPWTILNDEPISGGTLFWIDDGVDSGPILVQRFFHVAPDETAATLYARHMSALGEMMGEALALLLQGDPPRTPQDERYASWAARRTPASGKIDWTKPARDIARLIRASGTPYPGAFTYLGAEPIHFDAASASTQGARHCAVPGQIVAIDGDALTIMCGDSNAIVVHGWQSRDTQSSQRPRLHAIFGSNQNA